MGEIKISLFFQTSLVTSGLLLLDSCCKHFMPKFVAYNVSISYTWLMPVDIKKKKIKDLNYILPKTI